VARKYDEKVSLDVASQHAATANAGRYNKHLLPGNAASYEACLKKGRELRSFYYENTLPWSKDGHRILPVANYGPFSDGVRKRRSEYMLLAEQFLREYPILKEDARILLNGMYRESDYPSVDEMRAKFSVELEVLPLPSGDDFRVKIADEELERLRAEVDERLRREFAEANRDLWNRLYEAVSNMALRLGNSESRFHDTLVENVRELLALLPRLNVTESERLNEVLARCEPLVAHSPATLRADMGVRQAVASRAAEITNMIAAYMED
jgi:hypothetical protein